MAKRIITSQDRLKDLMVCMVKDDISLPEKVKTLKLQEFTTDSKFKRCKTMGQIVQVTLDFVQRNYENVSAR